jgi:hypothetical protein
MGCMRRRECVAMRSVWSKDWWVSRSGREAPGNPWELEALEREKERNEGKLERNRQEGEFEEDLRLTDIYSTLYRERRGDV